MRMRPRYSRTSARRHAGSERAFALEVARLLSLVSAGLPPRTERGTLAGMSGAPESHDLRGLKLSVATYLVVFALKLSAYFVTGVMALLAEGLHTLSDVFVSGFLLIAAVWSKKKPDEEHMFGYGRAQYVGALVAATLFISFTAFELFREAISHLLAHEAPHSPQHLGVALGALGVSIVLGLWPLVVLLRARSRGAAAKAQVLELINDQLGLVAALGGTLLLAAGYAVADPIAAMVVALIISVNGVSLFRENLSFLLGKSPGAQFLAEVEKTVRAVPGVEGLHRLRGQLLGPDSVQVDMHVEVKKGTLIEEANAIAHEVEDAVAKLSPGVTFTSVHVDPKVER
jgi:cation diffusion facilitator family transporter